MTKKREIGTARAADTMGVFKGHEADWFFQRSLAYMNEKAAEIGECFYAARRIDEKDPDSWIVEWAEQGKKLYLQAEEALEKGNTENAREAFMRSCNYYRIAEYGCLPSDPRFHELWEISVEAFHKACPLFNPPVDIIKVPFEDSELPAYFWQPDKSGKKRPTLVVAGGNDDTEEEDFFIIGPAAVRRGYNVFIFGYPGHRGAVHYDPKQVRRPDYEVPFKAALDLLETLPGVDERIALMGFSGGGYVAPRVAIYDQRIKAVIPNNPMIDYKRVADALLGPIVNKIPGFMLKWALDRKLKRMPLVRAYMEYGLWANGLSHMTLYDWMTSKEAQKEWAKFNITEDLHKITCPALALVGGGEGEEMLKQTEEFMAGISSEIKKMHVFTKPVDGSHDHCMLDNVSRMQYVTFEWLNEIFGHDESEKEITEHENSRDYSKVEA